ncbi:Protein RALF-like 22 [Hibiscus syriacus]|uniref:Protein RALF-like 22 n=1 Tax=Hibiscus syriacus TaxID=106335 RepID=A0A6A3AW25_HIBSY|nr:protein RALF-like 33 [Hibiscus syriacus]KAE8708801.1 Protein RALF-like 22 [Hibiscus syriacus]
MGSSRFPFCFLAICAILSVHVAHSASSPTLYFGGDNFLPIKSECSGSIAECLMVGNEESSDFDAEFAMGSEIYRRILARTRYISYGALRRNTVPCSRRGASYYNCRPGAQANPYSRGCSRITRCRR